MGVLTVCGACESSSSSGTASVGGGEACEPGASACGEPGTVSESPSDEPSLPDDGTCALSSSATLSLGVGAGAPADAGGAPDERPTATRST